jgi:hypothetical protein
MERGSDLAHPTPSIRTIDPQEMSTMKNAGALGALTVFAALGIAVLMTKPGHASYHARHHHAAGVLYAYSAPQHVTHRVCGWGGPGAPPRAIFSCRDE